MRLFLANSHRTMPLFDDDYTRHIVTRNATVSDNDFYRCAPFSTSRATLIVEQRHLQQAIIMSLPEFRLHDAFYYPCHFLMRYLYYYSRHALPFPSPLRRLIARQVPPRSHFCRPLKANNDLRPITLICAYHAPRRIDAKLVYRRDA